MAYFSSQIITNTGLQMLARVEAGITELTFSTIKIGDGSYTTQELSKIDDATSLKSLKQSYNVSSVSVKESTIQIRTVLSNKDLTEGYYIREVGIFAKENEGNEQLIAISICTGEATYLPEYDNTMPVEIVMSDFIAHSGGKNMETHIHYESDAYVSSGEFNDFKSDLYSEQITGSFGDITNDVMSPAFGGTFFVPAFTINEKSHIVEAYSHSVKIPNSTASRTSRGLMSSTDKAKLDGLLYEEGTWTPRLINESYKLAEAIGTYKRIGNICFLQGAIKLSNKETSSFVVQGLPFAISPITEEYSKFSGSGSFSVLGQFKASHKLKYNNSDTGVDEGRIEASTNHPTNILEFYTKNVSYGSAAYTMAADAYIEFNAIYAIVAN